MAISGSVNANSRKLYNFTTLTIFLCVLNFFIHLSKRKMIIWKFLTTECKNDQLVKPPYF